MAILGPIFRKAHWLPVIAIAGYCIALGALTIPWLQRLAIYGVWALIPGAANAFSHISPAHKFHTAWLYDNNKPEQFGFAKNQITPFNFTTPDNEILYAWHILPLGLYAKHESELLQEPSGCVGDITKTKGFRLLEDPSSLLIINFHGNAGSVAQGWRTDAYRAFSDGGTSRMHIIAVDYRGFGYSTGSPTEEGLILDGIATVKWALEVAKIPSERIVIIGHSLGTAVSTAVVECFARNGTEFAGVILIAGFTNLPSLLTSYSIAGFLPLFSPLRKPTMLQKWFMNFIVDSWHSATRLANYIRISKKVRLFIIHAKDDLNIPYTQSDGLFLTAANATYQNGLHLRNEMTAETTIHMGEGAFIRTWKADENKIIREQILSHGGHNRIITYAQVALTVLKAFGLDDDDLLPK